MNKYYQNLKDWRCLLQLSPIFAPFIDIIIIKGAFAVKFHMYRCLLGIVYTPPGRQIILQVSSPWCIRASNNSYLVRRPTRCSLFQFLSFDEAPSSVQALTHCFLTALPRFPGPRSTLFLQTSSFGRSASSWVHCHPSRFLPWLQLCPFHCLPFHSRPF